MEDLRVMDPRKLLPQIQIRKVDLAGAKTDGK